MEPDKVILKDNKIVYADLDDNTMVVDVEYKSNEEEQDSEKVLIRSDDYDSEWNKFQNIVTETKFRAFC